MDRQDLEQSKHVVGISPGGVRGEFPHLESGQVTILKKKPVVPAIPQHRKMKWKKPEGKQISMGPKAGGKKPEVKNPNKSKKLEKRLEEKKKET